MPRDRLKTSRNIFLFILRSVFFDFPKVPHAAIRVSQELSTWCGEATEIKNRMYLMDARLRYMRIGYKKRINIGFSSVTYETCPPLDVICVSGGSGVTDLLRDERTMGFVRKQAASERYVMSACTGVLLLGATGLARRSRIVIDIVAGR
jgi:putative intracellular protease/amidase